MKIWDPAREEWAKRHPGIPFPMDRRMDEPSGPTDAWTGASQPIREAWRNEALALRATLFQGPPPPQAPTPGPWLQPVPTRLPDDAIRCRQGHTNNAQASWCAQCGDVLNPLIDPANPPGGWIAGSLNEIRMLNDLLWKNPPGGG